MKRSIFALLMLLILPSAGAKAQMIDDFDAFITIYHSPQSSWATAVGELMDSVAGSEGHYWEVLYMAEDVLYDASSPLRNDLLWEHFLRHAVGEKSPLDEPSKERYRSILKLVVRNQQGSVAHNFTYTLADGSQGSLHAISAPYTVIYFYNPDCSYCARVKAQIEATGYLEMLHKKGLVEVLALYPDGDLAGWQRTLSQNPKWWITAYDKEQKINSAGLYDLKAIPTLYLLNSQKCVLLKDPTVETFLGALERILIEN